MPPSEPNDRDPKPAAKKASKKPAKKAAKKAAARPSKSTSQSPSKKAAKKPAKQAGVKKTSKKPAAKKKPTAKVGANRGAGPGGAPDERAAHRWTLDEVMAELEALGTAQNRKIYPRHGVDAEKLFGVPFAGYYALAKRIRPGTGAAHKLAFELWATENHDARMLACMLADPAGFDPVELDRWVKDADNSILADAIAALVTRTPQAESRVTRWIKAGHEFTQRCAWTVLAGLLKQADDPGSVKALPRKPASYDAEALAEFINTIETNIHDAPNRAAEAMNTCLIAIGTYRDDVRADAIAAAERIGDIAIDHGETNCKTPDAAPTIRQYAEHRKNRSGDEK